MFLLSFIFKFVDFNEIIFWKKVFGLLSLVSWIIKTMFWTTAIKTPGTELVI